MCPPIFNGFRPQLYLLLPEKGVERFLAKNQKIKNCQILKNQIEILFYKFVSDILLTFLEKNAKFWFVLIFSLVCKVLPEKYNLIKLLIVLLDFWLFLLIFDSSQKRERKSLVGSDPTQETKMECTLIMLDHALITLCSRWSRSDHIWSCSDSQHINLHIINIQNCQNIFPQYQKLNRFSKTWHIQLEVMDFFKSRFC